MSDWRQALPNWKLIVTFCVGVVAILRVIIWPETRYEWYMWVVVYYFVGLPFAKTIDNIRNIMDKGEGKE